MENKNWSNWDAEKHYGNLFFKRATGQLPEMESSKSVARLIKSLYQPGQNLLDVGCGAGHYLRSLRGIVSENIDYSGVDPTAYYIEQARKAWGEIREDKDWEDFDNTGDSKINTATRTFGEFQLSGNLILDWRYIILSKH